MTLVHVTGNDNVAFSSAAHHTGEDDALVGRGAAPGLAGEGDGAGGGGRVGEDLAAVEVDADVGGAGGGCVSGALDEDVADRVSKSVAGAGALEGGGGEGDAPVRLRVPREVPSRVRVPSSTVMPEPEATSMPALLVVPAPPVPAMRTAPKPAAPMRELAATWTPWLSQRRCRWTPR